MVFIFSYSRINRLANSLRKSVTQANYYQTVPKTDSNDLPSWTKRDHYVMSGLPRAIEVENHDNDVNVLKLNLSDYSNFLENSVFQNLPTMIHAHESHFFRTSRRLNDNALHNLYKIT